MEAKKEGWRKWTGVDIVVSISSKEEGLMDVTQMGSSIAMQSIRM